MQQHQRTLNADAIHSLLNGRKSLPQRDLQDGRHHLQPALR